MMYCQECVSLLGDYVDGLLSEERRRELEDHLSYCAPCVTFVRTYKATSRVARQHLARSMPEEMGARLHAFLEDKISKG